jgi:hypothetical protein
MSDTDFDTWFAAVDRVYGATLGLGRDDLGDAPWRDYHTDGLSPQEAVACALMDWQDADYDLLVSTGLDKYF